MTYVSVPRPPARPARDRRGLAAVEFALVAPFLVTLMLGMAEIARGLVVKEYLSDAAQKGCRTGVLPGKANSDVQADVANIMTDNNLTGYSVTVLLNGAATDVSGAQRFDQVSVKVSVPVSQVYWGGTYFLSGSTIESETVVMMRQG